MTTTLRVLAVCTGNTCRSPMAEAIVRARFADHGLAVEVGSVGTLGWGGRGASPEAVQVMDELGLDISGHRSRRIEVAHLDVDLVLAMTRDHAGAVIARDEGARASVFLPGELVRLLRRADDEERVGGPSPASTIERILRLGAARSGPTIGRAGDEVPDPAGESLSTYRATARRLDREISGLAAALSA